VDSGGVPAIDPTANVIALVKALAETASALREADKQFNRSQFKHIRQISRLRAANAETLRTSDLAMLAKTREVDVTTAASQAQALATAVQTLATNNDKNAEAIRNQMNSDRAALAKQVADTAVALGANNDSAMKDVNNRIAELQKSSYQGVGKSSVAEPMMAEFIAEMRVLAKGQDRQTGKGEGLDAGWKILIAVVMMVFAFLAWQGRQAPTTAAPAPQIIFTPAPSGTLLPSSPPATVPR